MPAKWRGPLIGALVVAAGILAAYLSVPRSSGGGEDAAGKESGGELAGLTAVAISPAAGAPAPAPVAAAGGGGAPASGRLYVGGSFGVKVYSGDLPACLAAWPICLSLLPFLPITMPFWEARSTWMVALIFTSAPFFCSENESTETAVE